jgi:hypothetical protein
MIRPNGSVCLLDFGIAKDMNSNGLTIGQVTIGTDGYMSPEQAGGYNIDHRSDIYSLGCVFFYMLTGHHAIEKKSNDHETRIAIIENDFPQAVDYNRNISANTQSILNKATHKNMIQRFQSCREFELELKGKRTMVVESNNSISIGRGDCDIIVAHPKVSQHHADIKIETQYGYTQYFFQDRSTNGTVIDGKNIHNSKIEIHPHTHPVILLAGTVELKWDTVEEIFRKKGNLVNSGDENIRFCSHCGAVINKDAAICVQCGCAVSVPAVSVPREQKIKTQEIKTTSGRKKTAVFVLNLIGLNWISRLITGHIGTGILVLLLYMMIPFLALEEVINNWIGILICSIIWIVDLITVCTNKWRTGDGKILTKW